MLNNASSITHGEEALRLRLNHPWSPSEDQWLTRMAAAGAKVPRIAQCLRRTTRSIRSRAEILQISWKAAKTFSTLSTKAKRLAARPWSAAEESLLRELIVAGVREDAIAIRLHRTSLAVRNRNYALKRSARVERGAAAACTES